MSVIIDLSSNFALIGKLTSDIFDKSAFKPVNGVDFDSSYISALPDSEPQRTQYLIRQTEETFQHIFEQLLQPAKNTRLLIKKEVIKVLIGIVKDSPVRHGQEYLENPALPTWRPKVKGLAFDCFRIIFQLSSKQFIHGAPDIVSAAVRTLQSRLDRKTQDLKELYSLLSAKIYSFLSTALGSSLISDVIPAILVRDLAECLTCDIWLPLCPNTSQQALTCLTLILQTRSPDLKSTVKDRIFSGLILSARAIIAIQQDRRLSNQEIVLLDSMYRTLTVFVLSTSVHVGVLNLCGAVFHEGLDIAHAEISVVCRMGLQVLSCILRPRVPYDVLDATVQRTEPATGRMQRTVNGEIALGASEFKVRKDAGILPVPDRISSSTINGKLTPIVENTTSAEDEIVLFSATFETVTATEETDGKRLMDQSDDAKRVKLDFDVSGESMVVVTDSISFEANDLIASFRDIATEDDPCMSESVGS